MSPDILLQVLPHWLRSFAFTLLVEVPIFVLMTRGSVSRLRAAVGGALGTCMTHPCLWFVWPRLFRDYAVYITSGEILIVLVESVVFFLVVRTIRWRRALWVSFVANAVSYGVGLAIRFVA
jgi:hypothetical protein